MAHPLAAGLSVLTREGWQQLLTSVIPHGELEPPVRRRHRRYNGRWGYWQLLWTNNASAAQKAHATLVNCSPEGVMLMVRQEVPRYGRVEMILEMDAEAKFLLTGEVAHCTSTVGGYKIGIHLTLT